MSKEYNIYIQKGTDFHINLEVLEDNEPMSLELATAKMQVRQSYDDDVLLEFSTENNKLIINETDSTIDIKLTKTESAALYFKEALYDLLLTNNLGDTFLLLKGKVFVNKTVTNG